jgi:hypothetical protein
MLNLIVWNLVINKLMVVAKKMEVSSCSLNFSAHLIEVVIILIVLKLLIWAKFAQMQYLRQMFLAFIHVVTILLAEVDMVEVQKLKGMPSFI